MRGSDLVRQILAFSRQSEQKKIPVLPQQILKEVIKLSRSTIPAYIDIIPDLQNNCGWVIADPTQLHQVVMNLITNAYHAMENMDGKISVKLRETEPGKDDFADKNLQKGRYAMITVSDNGCGIDSQIVDKIFDPYFTTKEQGKGTGLGLSVVYGIVKEHGGEIKVSSETGKGTTFRVYLPLKESAGKKASEKRKHIPQTGSERILLVDDEETVIRLECMMLERLGYRVTPHLDSQDALDAFRTDPYAYDLVMTDMTMPKITGDILARELISVRPDIPVIICTGFSEKIDKKKAASIGIKGFLMKPAVKNEMAEMIRKALDEGKDPVST
jgi:CheY-like chemotaxis protein